METQITFPIETALNALAFRIPEPVYRNNVSDLTEETSENWKKELLQRALNGKIPFGYSLTMENELRTKTWQGVSAEDFENGTLIIFAELTEFDPH